MSQSKKSASPSGKHVASGAHHRKDDGNAFFPDPQDGGRTRVRDDLAESLAEGFLESATSGEERGEEAADELVEEEVGGPFVLSTAGREFAEGTDESNPEDAEVEPFPRTSGSAR